MDDRGHHQRPGHRCARRCTSTGGWQRPPGLRGPVRRRPGPLPPDQRAAAISWLSRGLHEALCAVHHRRCLDRRWRIRAAVYEFTEPSVLAAFLHAHAAGADIPDHLSRLGRSGCPSSRRPSRPPRLRPVAADPSYPRGDRAQQVHRPGCCAGPGAGLDRLDEPQSGRHLRALQCRARGARSSGGAGLSGLLGAACGRPGPVAMKSWTDAHSPFDAGRRDRREPRAVQPALGAGPAGLVCRRLCRVPVEHPLTLPFGLDDAHFEAHWPARTARRAAVRDAQQAGQPPAVWSADPMVQVAVGALGPRIARWVGGRAPDRVQPACALPAHQGVADRPAHRHPGDRLGFGELLRRLDQRQRREHAGHHR